MRMKVPVTSTMFTMLFANSQMCVCVFRTECSQAPYLSVCVQLCLTQHTAQVFIYPAHQI
ncbi:hypothetical protein Hanom_Chr07g00594821 [Helianthus anomalus]